MPQTPIKDCFWVVEIKQCGTLPKWYWFATTQEETRVNDYSQSVEFKSVYEAKKNWEEHAKAIGIKKWSYKS